ncbi:MAG: hypothetical protein ABIO44_08575 [Saprospiraceae bacterium]
MPFLRSKYFYVFSSILLLYGCIVTKHSDPYQKLLNKNLKGSELGQMKFLYGDMGGIYPHTLKSNGFVYKIALLALSTISEKKFQIIDSLFASYGFGINPADENPYHSKPIGLIFGSLSGIHPIKGKYQIEVADLGCGSCHSGALYGKDGMPSKEFVLGMPNTSLNLDVFSNDLFKGYINLLSLNEKQFQISILKLFPETSSKELNGLKIFFKQLKKEVPKILKTRNNPALYKIGGPGLVNGIGAIKAGLGLINSKTYDDTQGALNAIPALANISFKSSLLVSGNYAPIHSNFFEEISCQDTSYLHAKSLAKIVSIFTIGTMGYNAKLASKALTDIEEIMIYLSKLETPPFPASINLSKSELGRNIFQLKCQSCHGTYEGSLYRNKLLSFPNKLIALEQIGTDSIRALAIHQEDFNILQKLPQKGWFQTAVQKGYVAPVLSGIWATAPYFHNNSVPTLWHLFHPESRPKAFYCGGHELDYERVGIKGILKNGIYQYNYPEWSNHANYDTQQRGLSNLGHEKIFNPLTETEKENLIEFLKTL